MHAGSWWCWYGGCIQKRRKRQTTKDKGKVKVMGRRPLDRIGCNASKIFEEPKYFPTTSHTYLEENIA